MMTITCTECGREKQTRHKGTRTCSRECGAKMRQRISPTPSYPRDYPPEIVARVRELYEGGLTRVEVKAEIGPGYDVETIMQRNGIPARKKAKRNQTGDANASWRGADATYKALHYRVAAVRGKPQQCNRCGRDDADVKYEWANLTGNYVDTDDYERMCVPCHRAFDAERRKSTGQRTSPPCQQTVKAAIV